ncbi:MAG: three-Cys-motif partner protein TcmP [Chryseolinea sp.]
MNSKSRGSVPNFQDDGLSITAAEPWFKVKVQLVQSYLQAFMMNAFQKADEVVFVDLFAGSGLYSIGYQKEIFASSGFQAMSSSFPFTKWIFCERQEEQLKALDRRIRKYFPRLDTEIIDTSERYLEQLVSAIPVSKPGRRVAVICLVDAFSLDIPISTVNRLTSMGFSLLMPFTFVLNNRMSCRYYVEENSEILRRFLGDQNMDKLKDLESNQHFYKRLVRLYQNNMLVSGFNAAISTHRLQSRMMELPAYNVGFFSRQFSAMAVQKEVNGSEFFQYELW